MIFVAGTRRDGGGRLPVRLQGRQAELPAPHAWIHLFKS